VGIGTLTCTIVIIIGVAMILIGLIGIYSTTKLKPGYGNSWYGFCSLISLSFVLPDNVGCTNDALFIIFGILGVF
jgi:hypothetical protein